MSRKLLIGVAPVLAIAVVVAISAAAQASPQWFFNGKRLGSGHQPVIAVGEQTVTNETLGALTCTTAGLASIFNESEKGVEITEGGGYAHCKAQVPCKVKNTRGEEAEGISLTFEAPPTVVGTEGVRTGISSLPWTGELTEKEPGVRQVLTHHVKIWVILPPPGAGTGQGCIGASIPFEDQEGPTEKKEGDELAPIFINGSKNGLHPSHGEFLGEEGKTEKGFPKTGRLISPALAGSAGYTTAKNVTTASSSGAWELITAE
jgi:hypothetical protein